MAKKAFKTMSYSHGVKDLVITCVDYRFRDKAAAWIKENLNNQADLVAVAGASKAFLEQESADYVLGTLKLVHDLHGVKTVHIIDHIDCGAWGGSKQHACEEDEFHFHEDQCHHAEEIMKKHFPDVTVKNYIATFQGVTACK